MDEFVQSKGTSRPRVHSKTGWARTIWWRITHWCHDISGTNLNTERIHIVLPEGTSTLQIWRSLFKRSTRSCTFWEYIDTILAIWACQIHDHNTYLLRIMDVMIRMSILLFYHSKCHLHLSERHEFVTTSSGRRYIVQWDLQCSTIF